MPGAPRCVALLVAAAVIMWVPPAVAQAWKGTGRVSGVVRDEAGEPIPGASALVRWARDPETGPPAVETNEKGRWALLGLAPGPWLLVVKAEGYRQSTGTVEVRQGATPPAEVTLLRLLVQTPTSSEGRLESIRVWIDTGNTLLERGEWAAARAEYEKVLAELHGRDRAEVLRSVARTYYMEEAFEQAVVTLEEAVLAAPGDEMTTVLYRSVMESQGRSGDAESFLAAVADGLLPATDASAPGVGTGVADVGAVDGASPAARPDRVLTPVAARKGRLGSYATSFDQRHPLADIEVFVERFEYSRSKIERTDPTGGNYDLAGETFEVFVPKSYDGSGEWGLFVWVSPTPAGKVPTPGAEAALARQQTHLGRCRPVRQLTHSLASGRPRSGRGAQRTALLRNRPGTHVCRRLFGRRTDRDGLDVALSRRLPWWTVRLWRRLLSSRSSAGSTRQRLATVVSGAEEVTAA